MNAHPELTIAEASTWLVENNYFTSEYFQYKTENGELVNGEHQHQIDGYKVIDEVMLKSDVIGKIDFTSADVTILPGDKGTVYMGK